MHELWLHTKITSTSDYPAVTTDIRMESENEKYSNTFTTSTFPVTTLYTTLRAPLGILLHKSNSFLIFHLLQLMLYVLQAFMAEILMKIYNDTKERNIYKPIVHLVKVVDIE